MKVDYTAVTETPGIKGSKEQLERLCQRYHFALQFSQGKEVLEVACGAGQGIGYIAKVAKHIVGGDIDENNLKFAQEHYKARANIELKVLDAHQLSFDDKSFDVVILYEALYYLSHPEVFLDKCQTIIRNNGSLLICTVNKDWADFNPSPHSTRYFSPEELYQVLSQRFADVNLYGGFPTRSKSVKDRVVSLIKRTAVALHIVPKTMKGKELLKRIFFGELVPLPPEIEEGTFKYVAPVPISTDSPNREYKVIYAVAHAPLR